MPRLSPVPVKDSPRVDEPKHLITFKVPGRAVPWSVPDVGRDRRGITHAHKAKALKKWQRRIAMEARVAWGFRREAWVGPVGLTLWFYVREPRGRMKTADLTNLVKATEDALQGIVIANDKRVCGLHAERYEIGSDEPERVFVEVWAMPTVARYEPTDPGPYAFRFWDWLRWLLPTG